MVSVLSLEGKLIEKIELPRVLRGPVREDLILRAFLATMSKRRQSYGTDVLAGLRTSAHYHGRRRTRYTMMNREFARLPRLHGRTVPFLAMQARIVPQARGGRRAHPPKVGKNWEQKLNKKEREKAVICALAATARKDLVEKRGHKIGGLKEFPVVVEDKLEEIARTKDLVAFLKKIGLGDELDRIKQKKIRAGKGKRRGRRYRKRVGILFVIAKDRGITKAVKSLVGCHAVRVENLSVDALAPGAVPGRLTVFTKSAIENLKQVG